jgi:hypothetical protein
MQQAAAQAAELHDRAMLLGYDVGAQVTTEAAILGVHPEPLGEEAVVLFTVWRVDQPKGSGETFTTTDEVEKHLEHLATLPRYCLELVDNPRIEVVTGEDGMATWITDSDTGEKFAIKTADLENATRLCVHADSPPTIGNWSQA